MAQTTTLRRPFVVPMGTRSLVGRTFVLAPDFRMPYEPERETRFGLVPRGAVWVPPGHPGLEIRGCRIVGWPGPYEPRWTSNHPDWIGNDGTSRPLAELSGVHADQVEDLTIEDLLVEGMPHAGVYLAAVRRARLRLLRARRCFSGVYLDYFSPLASHGARGFGKRLSEDVALEECVAQDNRGMGYPPREEAYRDIYDPAACIGSEGFYLYACDRLRVVRCASLGSNKGGMKIGLVREATIDDFYGRSIFVQGSLYWSAERGPHQLDSVAVGTPEAPLLSSGVRIRNPTLYHGTSLTPDDHVGFALANSFPTASPTRIEGGHIWRPRTGRPYLQAWEGVSLEVVGVTFHGPTPAPPFDGGHPLVSVGQYGGPFSQPSRINDDFLTVNQWRERD